MSSDLTPDELQKQIDMDEKLGRTSRLQELKQGFGPGCGVTKESLRDLEERDLFNEEHGTKRRKAPSRRGSNFTPPKKKRKKK